MKRNFSENAAIPSTVNGYKPVMTVNAIDGGSDSMPVKRKFLQVLKFIFKFIAWTISVIVLLGLISGFLLFGISKIQDRPISETVNNSSSLDNKATTAAISVEIKGAEKKISGYERQLLSLIPKTPYIIINTSENEFNLYSGSKLIRNGKCSTGSYTILQKSEKEKWIFKTPRGSLRIHGKITSPVWIKPDWAFIEEGLPVPPRNHPSRYEYGSLGDYALSLGDGYLIHGTLYKRLLGMPVTHGCIRMNDEDLEVVYKTLNIGSKVYIY